MKNNKGGEEKINFISGIYIVEHLLIWTLSWQ